LAIAVTPAEYIESLTLQGKKGMSTLLREHANQLRDAQPRVDGTQSSSAGEDAPPPVTFELVPPEARGRRGRDQSQRCLSEITPSTDISQYHLAAGPDIQQAMKFFQESRHVGVQRLMEPVEDVIGNGSEGAFSDDSDPEADHNAEPSQELAGVHERSHAGDAADEAAQGGVTSIGSEQPEPEDWIDDTGPDGLNSQEQDAYENQDSDGEDVSPESPIHAAEPQQRQSKDTVVAAYIMEEISTFVVRPLLMTLKKHTLGLCTSVLLRCQL
jgi:hypothetical protein